MESMMMRDITIHNSLTSRLNLNHKPIVEFLQSLTLHRPFNIKVFKLDLNLS